MNAAVNWSTATRAGSYFQIAMHEIGHLLGLGHTYELPALTIQSGSGEVNNPTGNAEGVFPGDADILLGQYLHPPVGNDIHVYQFALAQSGPDEPGNVRPAPDAQLRPRPEPQRTRHRHHALRLRTGTSSPATTTTTATTRSSGCSWPSGTYYVAVTSTGNTNFDPDDPGHGRRRHDRGRIPAAADVHAEQPQRHQGHHTARCWTATATARRGASTTSGSTRPTPAQTIFVDKAATGDGTGSWDRSRTPTRTSPTRWPPPRRSRAGTPIIVRIEGNGGADNNLATVGRQSVLQHRLRQPGQRPLSGRLDVPDSQGRHRDDRRRRDHQAARAPTSTSARCARASTTAAARCRCWARPPRTPRRRRHRHVYFTSYYNTAIGTDPGTAKGTLAGGQLGRPRLPRLTRTTRPAASS